MRTGARRSHSLSAQSVEADNMSASLARTDHTAPECASTESVHVSVRRSHLVRNFGVKFGRVRRAAGDAGAAEGAQRERRSGRTA